MIHERHIVEKGRVDRSTLRIKERLMIENLMVINWISFNYHIKNVTIVHERKGKNRSPKLEVVSLTLIFFVSKKGVQMRTSLLLGLISQDESSYQFWWTHLLLLQKVIFFLAENRFPFLEYTVKRDRENRKENEGKKGTIRRTMATN